VGNVGYPEVIILVLVAAGMAWGAVAVYRSGEFSRRKGKVGRREP
jgi:hypothetical protein